MGMNNWFQFRRSNIAEMRPYVLGEDMTGISISDVDVRNGSPMLGDMIARNPQNHEDQWLVARDYFKSNFEELNPAGKIKLK